MKRIQTKRFHFVFVLLISAFMLFSGQAFSSGKSPGIYLSNLLPDTSLLVNTSEIVFPYQGLVTADSTLLFRWTVTTACLSYLLEIAVDEAFSPGNLFLQQYIADTMVPVTFSIFQPYFCRLTATASNGDTLVSPVISFRLFHPTSLSSLRCWYAADYLNFVNGSPVPAWIDRSPYQVTAQNPVSAQQPVFLENRLNGKPSVSFDGTNDLLVSSSPSNSVVFDVFTVSTLGLAPGPYYNGSTSGNGYGFFRSDTAFYGLLLGGAAQLKFGKVSSRGFQLWECSRQPGQTEFFVNGTKSGNTFANTPNPPAGNAFLGGVSSGYLFKGELTELLFFNQKLSSSDNYLIYKYLHDKYSPPPLQFPANVLPVYSFCPYTLAAAPVYYSYLWSNGDTTPSTLVSQSGWIKLQVTDLFHFISEDSLYIQFPATNLTDSILCLGDSLLTDMNIGPDYSYTWLNQYQDTLSVLPTLTLHESGTFTLLVGDTIGCQIIDNMTVTIDSFPDRILLIPDTSLCQGTILSVQHPDTSMVTWMWSNGVSGSGFPVDTSGNYSITVTNSNNCTAVDSIQVTVNGVAPMIDFQADNLCFGDTVSFVGMLFSADSIVNWYWDFGDGHIGSSKQTVHGYVQPGIYEVTLTAQSLSGCQNTQLKNIPVLPLPSGSIMPDSCCQDLEIIFTAQLVSVPGDSISTWYWDFGDSTFSVEPSPHHTFSTAGTYPVNLLLTTEKGCQVTLTNALEVLESTLQPATFQCWLPYDNQLFLDTLVLFQWSSSNNAQTYTLQLSSGTDFSPGDILLEQVCTDTSLLLPFDYDHPVYWRVIAYNLCRDSIATEFYTAGYFSDSMPGLRAWYRADRVNLPDGYPVDLWKDESGLNHNAGSADPMRQPLLRKNALNGKPVLQFDGINDVLVAPLLSDTLVFDMIAVSTLGKKPGPLYNGNTANNGYGFYRNDTNAYGGLFGGVNQMEFDNTTNYGFQIQEFTRNQGITRFLANNKFSGASFTMNPMVPAGNAFIGGASSTLSFNGKIAELLFFEKGLSSQERNTLFRYLHDKYAPPPVELGPARTSPYTLCPVAFQADTVYSQYQWSTGDTSATTTFHENGWLFLTVTDLFEVVSMDSVFLHYPLKNLKDTTLCLGDTVVFNSWFGDGYTYEWRSAEQGLLTNDSAIRIFLEGTYWVKVTDSLGCSLTDTLKVSVDSFAVQTHLEAGAISLCRGDYLGLSSTGLNAESYLWSTGAVTPSILILTTGSYAVTVTDQLGCRAVDSASVTFHGLVPIPQYEFTDSVCNGLATSFTDLSHPDPQDTLATIVAWSWNFGDSVVSSTPNPFHIFTVAGTHEVSLTVATDSGCFASLSQTVFVTPLPQAHFYTAHGCTGVAVPMVDQSYHPIGHGLTWNWDFGDPASGIANFSMDSATIHTYDSTGIFSVQLVVVSTQGCRDTTTREIEIIQSPAVDFSYSQACKGEVVQFTDQTSVTPWSGILSWAWDFGDGSALSTLQHPAHTYATADTLQVMLSIQTLQCEISITKPVVVDPVPLALFNGSDLCQQTSFQLLDQSTIPSGSITQWYWDLGSLGNSSLQNPVIQYADTGSVMLSLCVTSAKGCSSDTVRYSVEVFPLPEADFDYVFSYVAPNYEVSFTNQSSGNVMLTQWDFGDGSSSTESNPVHWYSQAGQYLVTLVTLTVHGCSDTSSSNLILLSPLTDIAVSQVYSQGSRDWLGVSADLVNLGNTAIESVDLQLRLNEVPYLTETWNGLLAPGNSFTYHFVSQVNLSAENAPCYYCVQARLFPINSDFNLSDNVLCRELQADFFFPDPYPNPITDELNVPFILNQNSICQLELINTLGQRVLYLPGLAGKKGLNQVHLSLGEKAGGFYILRLWAEGEMHEKKIMKE